MKAAPDPLDPGFANAWAQIEALADIAAVETLRRAYPGEAVYLTDDGEWTTSTHLKEKP